MPSTGFEPAIPAIKWLLTYGVNKDMLLKPVMIMLYYFRSSQKYLDKTKFTALRDVTPVSSVGGSQLCFLCSLVPVHSLVPYVHWFRHVHSQAVSVPCPLQQLHSHGCIFYRAVQVYRHSRHRVLRISSVYSAG